MPSFLSEGIFGVLLSTFFSFFYGLYPGIGLKSDIEACVVFITDAKLTKDLITL